MRLVLAVTVTFAISSLVCIEVRRKRLDACAACHRVAVFEGGLLTTESGFPLLFTTQTEADRYAREFGAHLDGSDGP